MRDMFTTRMFLCAMSRNETASLRDHAKVTVKMIDVALKNMDVDRIKRTDIGSPLDPRIIGRAHGLLRPYGLTGQYWERLGETFIDVVLTQEAVRDLPGAGQAWVIFTACVVDQLRAGFEESRLAHQMFTRREEVLHHATMHLYETELQEARGSKAVVSAVLLSTSPPGNDENEINSEPSTSNQAAAANCLLLCLPRQQSSTQQCSTKLSKDENISGKTSTLPPSEPGTAGSTRKQHSNAGEALPATCVKKS